MVYDGLDRLTIANSAPQPQLRTETPWAYSWGEASFRYDGLDNIRTFKMASVDFTYAYDSNGRLQSVSQAWVPTPVVSYTHNARGQMTGRQFGGQQFTLNWDSAHRVTQTWNAASSVVEGYRYDAHGHRVRTVRGSETVYQVYTQAGDLLWETSTNGATRKYARLGGRLIGESVNGGRYAIHTDVIGSVRQKTDVLGTLVHEDVRAPYGSTLLGGEYQNGPAFTGHMEDGATGLTYMKARYYDPVAMRFLSPDPVYVDLSTGGNFNRYWYANNNPYTYVDPDGRLAFLIPFVPAAATALGKAVVFVGTAAVAGYAGSEAINYYNEATSESDDVAPVVPEGADTRESDYGCIYCVSGENTESGKEYIGSTDDLGARQRDKSDGRDREGAEIVSSYPKGDREARQNAEQNAINDRGGRDALDNRRNEVRPSRWEERGIRPPPTGTRIQQR